MKWQTTEISPGEGQVVLVGWPGNAYHLAKFINGDFWFQPSRGNHLCKKIGFTHWMELLDVPDIIQEQCPTCGDHHEPGEVPRECETGDGV